MTTPISLSLSTIHDFYARKFVHLCVCTPFKRVLKKVKRRLKQASFTHFLTSFLVQTYIYIHKMTLYHYHYHYNVIPCRGGFFFV